MKQRNKQKKRDDLIRTKTATV